MFTSETVRPSESESKFLQWASVPNLDWDAWSHRWKLSQPACWCCQEQRFWKIKKTVPGQSKATEKYLYTVVIQVINHSDFSHEDLYTSEACEDLNPKL